MLYKIISVLGAGEIDRVVRVIPQQEVYARLDLTTPVYVAFFVQKMLEIHEGGDHAIH